MNQITKLFSILYTILTLSCCDSYRLSQRYEKLESRIGKKIELMIMSGFRDEDADYVLKNGKNGGIILFSRDYLTKKPRNSYSSEILSENIKKIRESGIKFIAIDQEGGFINRLENIPDFNLMPSASKISKLKKQERIKIFEHYSKEIKNLGININLAPVVDIEINKDPHYFMNKFERIYSEYPEKVTEVASEFIDAAKKNKLIFCLKHFPGHGSAKRDTHAGFVDVTETWNEIELQPYKDLIYKKKIDMIMIAHIFNANIDDKYPASISEKTINGLLRNTMNYDGIVITDSIDMKALISKYGLKDIVIQAINAGNDIILHANQIKYDKNISNKIYRIILDAVYRGQISEKRIEESYKRLSLLLK